MKKLFIAAMALASVVACSKDEVVNQQQSVAISFEQVFVDNATRAAEDPSTTTKSIDAFDVWGFINQPSGVVLNDEDVTKSGNKWIYKNLQYWTPDDEFYFGALAPMNSDNWDLEFDPQNTTEKGIGTVSFTNIDGSEDLLYAFAHVSTLGMQVGTKMDPVKLNFDHLLSKVKFTFKNGMSNDNARVLVTDVKMSAPASGVIALGGDYTWKLDQENLTLQFGDVVKLDRGKQDEASKERLTIPASADYTYTIEFDVELFYGDVSAYKVHKTSTVEGIALEMGKAYNFTATIDADNLKLTPIEFDVKSVKEWDTTPAKDYVIDVISNSIKVNNATGMLAIAEGINNGSFDSNSNIVLNDDIDLAALQNRAVTSNWIPMGTEEFPFCGTIDGQGHKIINLAMTDANAGFVGYAGNGAVIKNISFENVNIESTKYGAAVVNYAEKNVTIENVNVNGSVKAASYAAGFVFDGSVNIKNCVNSATISSGRAAGIAAWLDNSVMENVVNNGKITGEISAAGISNRFGGTIKNARNYGVINGTGTEASAGIVGTQLSVSTYEYCYNYGDVTTTADNANSSASGILGHTPSKTATFNYCANFGKITAEKSYAAGIGYSLYGNIKANYCYNLGGVTGADGAGAIAPKAQYGANDTAAYCLNAGPVNSSNGKVYQGSNKNTNSYYYKYGELYNVTNNEKVDADAALQVLNGGTDNGFFIVKDGSITVNK